MEECKLPLLDFSQCGLDSDTEKLTDDELKPLANELLDSFAGEGVVYLLNHGIEERYYIFLFVILIN